MILFLFPGCAELKIGDRPISVEDVQKIRRGYTTQSEVLRSFGTALHNVPGPEGEIWVYRYSSGDSRQTPHELVVSFNGNVVSTYSYH